jgi:membrane associated rhomboid family serine protease
MAFMLALLTVAAVAFRVMTPDERIRLRRIALTLLRALKDGAIRQYAELAPFREALRARTRWAVVTPALAAVSAVVFVFMLFGAGALSDPQTLVSWGAGYGPRTTNGEWWRLLTSMFVHSGLLHLIVDLVALVQLGLVLERLVGHVAFVVVYLGSGILASLAMVWNHPLALVAGPATCIIGIYGLFFAYLLTRVMHRSTVPVPLKAAASLGSGAALFVLYHLAAGSFDRMAAVTALMTGFASGCALTFDGADGKPPLRRVAVAAFATMVIAVGAAIPLRGIADVRPEIARVVALEDRIANLYQGAVGRFKEGRLNAEALAQVIDRTIVPELHAEGARVQALEGVPDEQRQLVASADEYLRLRAESWHIRLEGLRKANMVKLREAEKTERASLEALQRIRPVVEN